MSGLVPEMPLAQRLGLVPDMRAWLPDMPAELRAEIERDAPSFTELELPDPPVDVAVMIVSHCATLDCELRMLLPLMAPGSVIWVGWPNDQAAKGLDEAIVRRIARPLHLTDAEACTLAGKWSGLKLTVPSGNRWKISGDGLARPASLVLAATIGGDCQWDAPRLWRLWSREHSTLPLQ